MQKEEVERIRKLCNPLFSLDIIKAIWLYGSSVRLGIRKGHDIDVMIILDDTKETEKDENEKLFLALKFIEEKAKNKNILLHFQEPKPLTLWWDLIRKGEPWAITSLKDIEIIHDPSQYLDLMQRLLKKGKLYSRDERAEKLLERARQKIVDVREIMLNKVPYEMLLAVTEAAQTALIYAGLFPPTPKDVLLKLKIFEKDKLLEQHFVDIYEEIMTMNEKIDRGTLSEFTGKELESWLKKVKVFILKMEEILLNLEEKDREKSMLLAYKESIDLCEKALKSRLKRVPSSDYDKILLFKKEFVDKGFLGKSHYVTLSDLYAYTKNKKARKELSKEKYLDKTYIKSLELAIQDAIKSK